MQTKTYTVIDVQELEGLIEEHLGVLTSHPIHYDFNDTRERFSIIADMEWNNDSWYDLGNFTDWMEELDEHNPKTYLYLEKLQKMGIIPSDHHILVEVSW